MKTFAQLYQEVLQNALHDPEKLNDTRAFSDEQKNQLDCLLNPQKHPVVWQVEPCDCTTQRHCVDVCPLNAIFATQPGKIAIDMQKCTGCAQCIEHCKGHKLVASRDIIPALQAVRAHQGPTYALVAPAFLGQFGPQMTPGKLRQSMKMIGFDGMIEVALFADILTLKEALEFDRNILTQSDYQLTSCCCPVWIGMIVKLYPELLAHLPASVSPMIASGRAIKHLHPDALTVFIGPCLAKKSEARERDIQDAVDYVLTFAEMQDVFDALQIDPSSLPESQKDHASYAGRSYAYAGGVSHAVAHTVESIHPNREIGVHTVRADGVPACKELLNQIRNGEISANFFEGMGCKGGCVGGPKRILDPAAAKENVQAYASQSLYTSPADNPYVIELLGRLGFDTIDSLLENDHLFTRHFPLS